MSTGRAARFTLFGQWGKFLVQMIGFVVLARLLSPGEFGIVAAIAPIVAFASMFTDLGLSLAGLQAKFLSQPQKSLLFLLNLSAGSTCALIVGLTAPLLAAFYSDARVIPVTIALGLSLVLVGAAVQFRVEMTRDGKYGALALQDSFSAFIALAAAVIVAALGAGYWALVVQSVVQPVVILVMAIVQSAWKPGKPAPLSEASGFLRFGGSNLLLQLLNLLSRSVDVMALGRAQTSSDVGLYSRSSQLISIVFQQVVSPLTRVVLPRLARARSEREFSRLFSQMQIAIAYGLVGLLSAVFAVAPSACIVILGDQWAGAGPIVRVLSVGAIFAALGYGYYWAFLARAQTGLLLLAETPGRAIMIIGAAALAAEGAVAVAAAIVAGQAVTLILQVLAGSRAGLPSRMLSVGVWRPAFIFTVATACSVLAQLFTESPFLRLLLGTGAWLVTVGSFLVVRAVRQDLQGIVKMVRGGRGLDVD